MREGWRVGIFSDVVEIDIQRVDVVPGREYPIAGVLGFGRGLLYRTPVNCGSTNYKQLNRVRPNQLVYSKLKAFEGAITVAPPQLTESYASSEFPTFTCSGSMLPSYLRLVSQRPSVWDALAAQSKGVGGRRERLHPRDLLSLELVIPPVDEQRRIASLIGALDAVMTHAEVHHAALAILLKRRRSALFEGTITRPAREVFDILLGLQRSPARAAGPHRTPYLRSANVSARGLRLKDVKSMSFEPSQQAKYALSSGDVLVTEGSASVDAVGAASVYHGELPGTVCFQNTLLRFRPIEGVSTPAFAAQWCAWAYESGAFREAASGTSIKHVGARGAAAMPVADVSHHAQNDMTFALVLAEKAVRAAEETLQRLRDLRASLLIALLSGAHEIPDTYDHLLAG